MGKKHNLSPYRVRLGAHERRVTDVLRSGGRLVFHATGHYSIDGGDEVDTRVAENLIAKQVVVGNGDAMFNTKPQSYRFNPDVLR